MLTTAKLVDLIIEFSRKSYLGDSVTVEVAVLTVVVVDVNEIVDVKDTVVVWSKK